MTNNRLQSKVAIMFATCLVLVLPRDTVGLQSPRPIKTTRQLGYSVPIRQPILSWRPSARSYTKLAERPRGDFQKNEETSSTTTTALSLITVSWSQMLSFSAIMALCGAALGPFLDSYHSAFGVLQYDVPISMALWGSTSNPALITAWWVPILFGIAGWLIGWLYILLDALFHTPLSTIRPSAPKIFLGISIFTFQYWLSGILVASGILDRTGILNSMSIYAVIGFLLLDGSMAGFCTSAATAFGGPLIEVGLLSLSREGLIPGGGYHYNDLGETGFFPLWIVPVYFLGGPAVGNLARGIWKLLLPELSTDKDTSAAAPIIMPTCDICNSTRCVECPNCDGLGLYVATGGRSIKCTSCSGRGFVMCRSCFSKYDEDPNDIESIREIMPRMPD